MGIPTSDCSHIRAVGEGGSDHQANKGTRPEIRHAGREKTGGLRGVLSSILIFICIMPGRRLTARLSPRFL